MAECRQCGGQIPEHSAFCKHCGASQGDLAPSTGQSGNRELPPYPWQPHDESQPPNLPPAQQGQPPYPLQPPYQGQPPYQDRPPYPGQPQYPGEPPKKWPGFVKWVLIGAGVLVVLVIAAVALGGGGDSASDTTQVASSDATTTSTEFSATTTTEAPTTTATEAPPTTARTTSSTEPPTTTGPASGWVEVTSLSGSGNKRGQAFELTGAEARLKYSVTNVNIIPVLSVFVVPEGDSLEDSGGFPEVMVTEEGSDSTMLAQDAGRYYLDVTAANCDWSVTIEELR